ncbi:MAG: PilT/PilU family type 4a pilus ATPase [Clostridiaceae bacterium]|nr:PilT/PilU family type 4a pilus ATPase [Eubacteriales bacterium]
MHEALQYLREAVESGASDIFIVSGQPLSYKRDGVIGPRDAESIMPDSANRLVQSIYALADRPTDRFFTTGDDDFSLSINGLSRFRVSAYRQRGSMAAVIRVVRFDIPDPSTLSIPNEVMRLAQKTHGLALITGPAGGGKSTTLACVIDAINATRNAHIITLEDPIEFLHKNKKSIVSQREVGTDTDSYLTALRACLRQSPDVILLGEMRDYDTIRTAMTAAETGHFVLSSLHTVGAVNTIDRIVDVFPPNQQQQIRVQLSMVLQTVISQQLVPSMDGELLPVYEIMHLTNSIRNLIRESKTHQIDFVIQSSAQEGMYSMDNSLLELYRKNRISAETALHFSRNVEQVARKL